MCSDVIDAFARRVDLAKLSAAQFIRLLETLHMLGIAGAGVEMRGMSTETLVDVVRRASKEQLRAVAHHPELRRLFLEEIFRRMSDHFLPEKAKYSSIVVNWRFSGGEGDGFDRFQTVIEDGTCRSGTDLGREPVTTITVAADDFFRVATGNAAAATMLVTGRIRVKGEYAPAVRFQGYFDLPRREAPR
ncbi:SCP2 sterol-binding domain-containing protein [Amycolatopsis sp. GM8]|uniref:SCP2 sterol-binding domain-containing protein n=1 Tax=Amycolatopsis sp. GM8 TaxID=2896530 RepID=UPI001F423A24|nr:SCP2 sterol-binding domain-containing protein [Amycolatopsis sp. GM8]